MSLSAKAIDRLFERLAATYGVAWTHQWTSVPIADAKAAWAHELAGFAHQMESLAWGLENLPERCPNVIEFRNLCRRAPAPVLPRLPEPKADPERLKRELSKLGEIRAKATATTNVDHKAWARRILGSYEGGCNVTPTTLRLAREALRISE
jgi:hypothetical protein